MTSAWLARIGSSHVKYFDLEMICGGGIYGGGVRGYGGGEVVGVDVGVAGGAQREWVWVFRRAISSWIERMELAEEALGGGCWRGGVRLS